ncbi:MAG: hypothetical protein WC338_07535 [Candidatus Ratteibacteria bacterium]
MKKNSQSEGTKKRPLILGPKPPEWLTTSETYGFGPSVPWQIVKSSKWRFMTHIPHRAEYLAALRSNNIRGFPYMTFYQTWINKEFQGARLSEHTDWIAIDEHGHWKRTGFWESEDSKNMYCTCVNTKGYRKSVLAYLEKLMDAGAGGIFLDNLGPQAKCWGEEHGKHKHLYPNQEEAFVALLKEAQALIRKKDPQGALLVNSASPTTLVKDYWPWIDCEMSESYICTWVSTQRWGDWQKQWNGMDKKISRWIKAGKQVCCLSYVGHTINDIKDDVYFCYASARLMNMIWQAGNATVYENPALTILYQIETGQPVAPERKTENGAHYRLFKNGMVAVNPTDAAVTVRVTHSFPTSLLLDLYSGQRIPMRINGKKKIAEVTLPAQSGRVYLFDPLPAENLVALGLTEKKDAASFKLTIETEPALGKTKFKVDETPLWTYAGHWTTKYEMGEDYGRCFMDFDRPGTHRVEALDLEKKSLLVANSYGEASAVNEQAEEDAAALKPGSSSRLGKLMDPSNPGKFMEGAGYKFVGWTGDIESREPVITVRVDKPIRLIAKYKKI